MARNLAEILKIEKIVVDNCGLKPYNLKCSAFERMDLENIIV